MNARKTLPVVRRSGELALAESDADAQQTAASSEVKAEPDVTCAGFAARCCTDSDTEYYYQKSDKEGRYQARPNTSDSEQPQLPSKRTEKHGHGLTLKQEPSIPASAKNPVMRELPKERDDAGGESQSVAGKSEHEKTKTRREKINPTKHKAAETEREISDNAFQIKFEAENSDSSSSVSYTHLTLPTSSYV